MTRRARITRITFIVKYGLILGFSSSIMGIMPQWLDGIIQRAERAALGHD
jgi:hypothetical protein